MKTYICKRCGKQHDLFYRVHANETKHLVYVCPNTRESFYLNFIADLDIPVVMSGKMKKVGRQSKQPSLF